jgi:hypothetical protein
LNVKIATLVPVPNGLVTEIVPVLPNAGMAVICVGEFTIKDWAFVPPKVTMVAPVKFVPVITTGVTPPQPDAGEKFDTVTCAIELFPSNKSKENRNEKVIVRSVKICKPLVNCSVFFIRNNWFFKKNIVTNPTHLAFRIRPLFIKEKIVNKYSIFLKIFIFVLKKYLNFYLIETQIKLK